MDNQDQKKIGTSGHEVHICHRCGWPFPNPHPSSKLRRAHKRICGSIEGYIVTDSPHLVVSDDEHQIDEDKEQTPSREIEKRSISSGGVGERSNRSEDEVFSDAVTEFADSGSISLGIEAGFAGNRDFDKNLDKTVEIVTAGSTELLSSPIESTKVDNLEISESPESTTVPDMYTNDAKKIEQQVVKKPSDVEEPSSTIICPIESTKVENLEISESPESTTVPDLYTNDAKKIEQQVIKKLSDVGEPSSTIICESFESENELQVTDVKTSGVDGAVHSKHDIFSQEEKSVECVEPSANIVQINADSALDTNDGSDVDKFEVSDTKGEEEEAVYVISVATDIPLVENSDILIEDFKDHRAMKSNITVTLDSTEVFRPLGDGNNDTVNEISADCIEQEGEMEKILVNESSTITCVDEEVNLANELGGNNADKLEEFKEEKYVTENQVLVISDAILEPQENSVESKVDHIPGLPGEDNAGELERSIEELFDITPSKRTETVAAEEKYAGNTNEVLESERQCLESTQKDSVSDSAEVDNVLRNSHFNSQKYSNEDSEEVVKGIEIDGQCGVAAECIDAVAMSSETEQRGDAKVSQGIWEEPILQEGKDKLTKQHCGVDVSVDSSSQNSLEGNWGSVSVLSTQSDALPSIDAETLLSTELQALGKRDNSEKLGTTLGECHSDKSDVLEPPSFMTLVESGGGVDPKAASSEIKAEQNPQQSKSEASQVGWFPSFTNISNESEGRKRNEEVIAKVTNWSTGKHTALKNLLSEANAENMSKSANVKQPIQKDEVAARDNSSLDATVKSGLPSEPKASSVEQVTKKEIGKEWNSPARYAGDSKKDRKKVKGKPYWVPFVCCSSVNVN